MKIQILATLLLTVCAADPVADAILQPAYNIMLTDQGNKGFVGPLFVGSGLSKESVIYDTNSLWVTVDNNGIPNAELFSPYDYNLSTTSIAQFKDSDKSTPEYVKLAYGQAVLRGQEYTDNMCLIKPTSNSTKGDLCVRNMPFFSISGVSGEFVASGVIGLAPNTDKYSFVNALFL